MANTKSAIKNIRKNERRRAVNKARKATLRTQIKKLRTLVKAKNTEAAAKELVTTVSVIDRSIRKGILHKNTAGRYKSRLTRSVRSLSAPRA
ncbi:MAG: 30S ribosomal protein S20 [Acidobacteria bacterium]|nr:MAG: 30S ribosomal protein S20 [Acidobacteriota bacterium]